MPKVNKSASTYLERKKAAMYAQSEVLQSRAARLLFILVLCVHPLYFNIIGRLFFHRAGYIDLTRHKFYFFVICMCVVLLFVLIIWINRMARTPRLLPQDRLYITDWIILGFAIVTLLSAILSPYRVVIDQTTEKVVTNVWSGYTERYDGAITQLLYIAVFFVVSRWYKPRERDLVVIGISASFVALIGIFQFYGMDFFKLWPYDVLEWSRYNSFNIFFRSTLGNVDIVSSYVCVAMLLCGFLFIRMKSKWQPLWLAASALNFWLMELADADSGRIGLLVTLLLAIPFIVETLKTFGRTLILASSWIAMYILQKLFYEVLTIQARTIGSLLPYIGAAVLLFAVGIALVIFGKERNPEDRAKWKLGVIIIAACLTVGIVGVEFLGRRDEGSKDTNIIYELREILHGNIKDEFGTNRVYIWRNALNAFFNDSQSNDSQSEDGQPKNQRFNHIIRMIIGNGPDTFYYAFPEEAQGAYGEKYENAHNEYVQILICQGIVGLVCYLAFIVGLVVKSVPKTFKNPLIMAVLAAFVGYCAQAFFNLSVPIVTPMLWVFAGLLANKRVREVTVKELAMGE